MYGTIPQQDARVGEVTSGGTVDDKSSTSVMMTANHKGVVATEVIPLCSSSPSSSYSFPSFLLFLVPERCPMAWSVINNSLAISGCILIVGMITTQHHRFERPYATAFHMIWEFAACFFWTLETSLSATYRRYYLHQPKLAWYIKLEIFIAAYFMAATFWVLLKWRIKHKPISDETIWVTILDTSFYIYLAVRQCLKGMSNDVEADLLQLHLDDEVIATEAAFNNSIKECHCWC